jgi:hypothetical protein
MNPVQKLRMRNRTRPLGTVESRKRAGSAEMKSFTHTIQWMLAAVILASAPAAVRSQMIIKSPKKNNALEQGRIAVTVIGRPGATAVLSVNGTPADSGIIRIDGRYDFLSVTVPEGPVELRASSIGAGGRLFETTVPIHIIGRPAKLVADPQALELPADSQSTAGVRIRVQDAWGYPVTRSRNGNIRISSGSIADPDADSLSAGWQVPVRDGRMEFRVRTARVVGREDLTVEVGDASLQVPVRYTTPLSPLILVGSADAAVSARQWGVRDPGIPKFTLADFTEQESEWGGVPVSGRLAFYAKGALAKKYMATMSFDSRRTRTNQLFRDLDPDKQYALYGDASTLTYDAQTESKFYGKIERNESFLAVGDFNTEFRAAEFAKYDRSFNGVFGRIGWRGQTFSGFSTLNDRTMKLDEIRGEGISGYYFLTRGRITINSDKVRIETRDRYHPEVIVESDDLARFQDYDINAVDGTLMFKQPVPSQDAAGNPVFIVASYECQDGSTRNLIGGLRYDGSWRKKIRLGSTVIVEEKKPSNYYLAGADAVVPLGKWLEFKGEVAKSVSSDFGGAKRNGSAFRTEMKLSPIRALETNGYYRFVDEDFLNPSLTGSAFHVGSEKYGMDNSLRLGRFGRIQSQVYRQINEKATVNENWVSVANAFYEYPLSERTTAKLGYEDAERRRTGLDTVSSRNYRSKMIKAQITRRWWKRLSTTVEHEQNLAGGRTSLPTGTALGAALDVTQKIQLFAKQRLLSGAGRRTQTLLGIDSRLNANTLVTGKYEIGGVTGEKLSRASIGLKNKWAVRRDLTFNIALESTATLDSLEVATPENNAVSVGFEYLPDKPWKTAAKYELRQDKTLRKQVLSLGGESRIRAGLSAIGRYERTGTRYLKKSNDVWNRSEAQLGVAYRPENGDAFNGIAKVQILNDKNTHVAPGARLDRAVISAHGYWEPAARLEFGVRFAFRRLLDEETGLFRSRTTTTLYALRTEYTLHRRWSTGLDLRLVALAPAGQTKNGAAADINYMAKQNMQVGVGYVFKKLDDPDFAYSEYSYSNIYLVLRMKFSEGIFDWK